MTKTEKFAHNTFFGENYLYASACDVGDRSAIVLENVPQITIGNETGGGLPNAFTAYSGISASNTNLDVFNTTFENAPAGIGIWLRGSGGTFAANITGLGNGVNDPKFMENMWRGIDARNYDLTVNHAYFDLTTFDHHIKMLENGLPIRLVLTENRFEHHLSDALSVRTSTFRDVVIADNEFRDNNPDGFEKSGIRWSNNQIATSQFDGRIRSNTYYDDEKTNSDPGDYLKSYGVFLSSSSGMKIEDNYFYQNYNNTDPRHAFKGLYLYNAPQNELISNGIFGNFGPLFTSDPIDLTYFFYRGIDLVESMDCFISCNHSQNLNAGFHFQGPACDKTDFRHNEMASNLTGLYLYEGSIIGAQADKENKWFGDLPANGVAEAHFDGTPGLNALLMSKFFINSSNQNSDLWANPRIPANNWFVPSDNPEGLAFICLKDEGPLPPKSKADDMLIGGIFEEYKGYPASGWEATLNAYATLANNPALHPENSPKDQFYDTHDTGNVGKFHRAREAWNNITLFSASIENDWEANAGAIDQKLAEIRIQNQLMEQAQTTAEQEQIAQTLGILKTELTTLQQVNQSLAELFKTEVTNRATQLAANLTDITATEVWEQNLKTTLSVSANRMLSGNTEWSTQQYDTLEAIADQCRHEGGIGVVLARAAIEKFGYDDEAMCPGWGQPRNTPARLLKATIAPNPSNGLCQVTFEQPATGQLIVRNVHGQLVQTVPLSEVTALNLNTFGWAAGLYFLEVKAGQSSFLLSKLAISH